MRRVHQVARDRPQSRRRRSSRPGSTAPSHRRPRVRRSRSPAPAAPPGLWVRCPLSADESTIRSSSSVETEPRSSSTGSTPTGEAAGSPSRRTGGRWGRRDACRAASTTPALGRRAPAWRSPGSSAPARRRPSAPIVARMNASVERDRRTTPSPAGRRRSAPARSGRAIAGSAMKPTTSDGDGDAELRAREHEAQSLVDLEGPFESTVAFLGLLR